MDTQPNEIITHILSYLDNYTLNITRRVNHRWKHLIETRLVPKSVPELHICILTRDYYHFGKHYLNYKYNWGHMIICNHAINENDYYMTLTKLVDDTFLKQIAMHDPPVNAPTQELMDEHILFKIKSKELILSYAAYKGHLEIVKILISRVDIHANSENVLGAAVASNQLEILQYLVTCGADIKSYRNSILQDAIRNNYWKMIKYVIEQGADIHSIPVSVLRDATPETMKFIESLKKN